MVQGRSLDTNNLYKPLQTFVFSAILFAFYLGAITPKLQKIPECPSLSQILKVADSVRRKQFVL